jgi:GH24 family phage-related lysozyme (muramidase)
MSDPRFLLEGWGGFRCDPRSPVGGGGPGGFRWAGPVSDPFMDDDDMIHPWSPACRVTPCVLGSPVSPAKQSTELMWADTATDFARWEDRVSHMYLDTVGRVTVGVGKMLPDAAAAKALVFVRRADGAAASAAEIETDFKEVSKQTKGKLAASYMTNTALDLPDVEIDKLLKAVVADFESDLKSQFSGYAGYPAPAKRALLDMIYNLGKDGLLEFRNLKKAAEARKWKEAAAQCHRIGPSQERNDWTRDMFLKAAE